MSQASFLANLQLDVTHDPNSHHSILISLTNTHPSIPVTILKWNSPLDPAALQLGLVCIIPAGTSQPIHIDAIKISRLMPPSANSLITLFPGERATNTLELHGPIVPDVVWGAGPVKIRMTGRWMAVWPGLTKEDLLSEDAKLKFSTIDMKLSLILISFATVSSVSASWKVTIWDWREKAGNFLSHSSSQSRIPQFLLDSKHPWVIENQNKLRTLPNVESYLCSPPKELAPDNGQETPGGAEHGLDIPSDLFDNIEISNIGMDISRPGWPNLLLRLREISRCPAALSKVKNFATQNYFHNSEYDDWDMKILEPAQMPREVLGLFAEALGNMTHLETLKLGIPRSAAREFEEYFSSRGLILPSVKRLELDVGSHFLVRMCPNITVLETWREYSGGDAVALLQATLFTPNLTRFAMMPSMGWTTSLIEDLVGTYMPGLQSLALWGGLNGAIEYPAFSDRKATTLKGVLQILGSLQNLTHLELPDASSLNVGWDGGPFCGNAYFGPGGREYERQVEQEGLEAVDRAAAAVIETIPRLTNFTIGPYQPNITRYENGTLRASFPWTGRMDEYILEVLPDRPDILDY
ncbi:hypothetical protein O1611_g4094 [Lasiodiplodia mahajangana]|uniref:Uncharacterized protein n=1 Tax=Lasiodiplodia mahajangana TaxID=1108764 RepID=A0ACC2JQA5_9PEZI|nr:hypothetical protein O1611_g4094 [Lasiodiplodia mahajangana]